MAAVTKTPRTAYHCHHVIEKNQIRKFCPIAPRKGFQYCPLHAPQYDEVAPAEIVTETADISKTGRKSRATKHDNQPPIPCPLDPSHFVSSTSLESHLKRCNAARQKQQMQSQPYYVEGINEGPPLNVPLVHSDASITTNISELEMMLKVKHKVDAAFERIKPAIQTLILQSRCLPNEELAAIDTSDTSSDASNTEERPWWKRRHLIQNSSIIGHLERLGFVGAEHSEMVQRIIFVEFGAGKGALSSLVYRACGGQCVGVVMADYGSFRHKADRYMLSAKKQERERKEIGTNDRMNIERLRIDIKDLHLAKVPLIDKPLERPYANEVSVSTVAGSDTALVVGISKHLCGVASDYALRCITKTIPVSRVVGIALTTCCHHRCVFQHYVNREFFERELDISPEEFAVIARLSSWATAEKRSAKYGPRMPSEENDARGDVVANSEHGASTDAISAEEKAEFGKKCKLLIDAGRERYLQQLGFRTQLFQYVDAAVTLENTLLVALPPGNTHRDR